MNKKEKSMTMNIEEKFPLIVSEYDLDIIKKYNKQLGIEPKIKLKVAYTGVWNHVLYFGSKKEKSLTMIIKKLKDKERKFNYDMDHAYPWKVLLEKSMSKHDPNEAIRISTKEPVAKSDYKTKDQNWISPKIPNGPTKEEFIDQVIDDKLKEDFIAPLYFFSEAQQRQLKQFLKAALKELLWIKEKH